ncbi:MAG TPA: MoaD/ThiS family protein [Verrucomicrobiae bacterium]|jgi:MoaD family protein|nr:MoaD/ThiS family protein [Verrucomicrobiae bacterium]
MSITVLFHSYFRDLTGCSEIREEVPAGSTIGKLRATLEKKFPKLRLMQRSTLIAVGVEYQSGDYKLKEGDEVSLFPPVQGG